MRALALLPPFAVILALALSSGTAAAQGSPEWRFRGGVGFEGGAFIAPGAFSLPSIGGQVQLGGQHGPLGLYNLTTADGMFGAAGGFSIGSAFVVDYTFADRFSIGAGPEASFFLLFSDAYNDTIAAGPFLLGGRLDFRWYPLLVRSDSDPRRRKALSIGLDVRMAYGLAFSAPQLANGMSGNAPSGFVLWPQLSISYQAF